MLESQGGRSCFGRETRVQQQSFMYVYASRYIYALYIRSRPASCLLVLRRVGATAMTRQQSVECCRISGAQKGIATTEKKKTRALVSSCLHRAPTDYLVLRSCIRSQQSEPIDCLKKKHVSPFSLTFHAPFFVCFLFLGFFLFFPILLYFFLYIFVFSFFFFSFAPSCLCTIFFFFLHFFTKKNLFMFFISFIISAPSLLSPCYLRGDNSKQDQI